MLVKATGEDVERYADLAYALALDPSRSAYPTYGDGIKTKADFLSAARSSVEKELSQLLLFELDSTVEGWISYYWIPEEKYLQLSGCNIRRGTEQALAELLERLQQDFPGYTLYFGFPGENETALRFLEENGWRCIEVDWNHSFFFDSYVPQPLSGQVVRIGRENFADFRAVYHPDAETYWNCDRIYETLGNWIIFVYCQDGAPVGTVFFRGNDGYYEIYGVEFLDGEFREDAFRALLTAALNACKADGARFMTYFCSGEAHRIAGELHFRCVGQYVLYIKTLEGGAQ